MQCQYIFSILLFLIFKCNQCYKSDSTGNISQSHVAYVPLGLTFPKVSGGDGVSEAGSRGQGEMLQQIYSLQRGRGAGGCRGERARMDILP